MNGRRWPDMRDVDPIEVGNALREVPDSWELDKWELGGLTAADPYINVFYHPRCNQCRREMYNGGRITFGLFYSGFAKLTADVNATLERYPVEPPCPHKKEGG